MFTRALLVALTAVVSQSQQNVPPRDVVAPASGSGAISGRITDKETGRPLHRASVTLTGPASSQRTSAVADLEGRYQFTGLAPGEYSLWASAGDLRATHLAQALGQTSPLDLRVNPPRSALVLKPGEIRADVDVALGRALAIEGRVLDGSGQPMSDVQVRVTRADGSPVPAFPVSSDDRGEFRLFGLSPGRYRICASAQARGFLSAAPPATTSRLVDTCYPSAATESSAHDVVLSTEDAAGIDIRMQRIGASSASGSVVDESGLPVDGAWVNAYSIERRSGASGANSAGGGRFTLTGLTPGRYVVTARIGGPANPDDTRPPGREHEFGFATVDVAGSNLDGVVVAMSRGQTVAGRVIFDGSPAPRPDRLRMVVQLRLPDTTWNLVRTRPPYAAVSEDLRFELKGLFRLPQIVGIGDLPEGWGLKMVRYGGKDITDRLNEFGPVKERSSIEIVLTNRIAEPSVRVVDDQGSPVPQYFVVVLPADGERWQGAILGAPGRSSQEPVMNIGPRLPGDYFIAAVPLEDARLLEQDRSRLEDLFTAADRIALADGDRRTLEIRIRKLPPARR